MITFSAPSFHSPVSEEGMFGHRQAKLPSCAAVASAGELSGAAGVNVSGR